MSDQRETLRQLVNEVKGMLAIAGEDLRAVIGNTNLRCLQTRLDEAKAALLVTDASPQPPQARAKLMQRFAEILTADLSPWEFNGTEPMTQELVEAALLVLAPWSQPPQNTELDKLTRYEYALRNCHMLARREARREQKADNSKSSRWNHIIRLCKDADTAGTLTSSSILRDKESAQSAPINVSDEKLVAVLREASSRIMLTAAALMRYTEPTALQWRRDWVDAMALMQKAADRIEVLEGAAPSSQPTLAMRAALQPFADVGQWLFARDLPDDTPMVELHGINGAKGVLTRGHFKAAFSALNGAALSPQEAQPDEEMEPHPFNSRTFFEPGDDRDIWCRDCEYHRDHMVHGSPQETQTPQSEPCRVCGGGGFVATKQFIDDGFGEVDSCPACSQGIDEQEKGSPS